MTNTQGALTEDEWSFLRYGSRQQVEDVIAARVQAERERCQQLADEWAEDYAGWCAISYPGHSEPPVLDLARGEGR